MPRICKVLIVEDDEHVRNLLAEAFDADGFEFSTATSGAQMRAALAASPYDIAVIDVLLSGDDNGFDLAEEARRKGCAVILTTGDHSHEGQVGASGLLYLLKPFRISELKGLADRILQTAEGTCVRRGHPDPNTTLAPPI